MTTIPNRRKNRRGARTRRLILIYMASYYHRHHCPPTLRETAEYCGSSMGNIGYHIKQLIKTGCITPVGADHSTRRYVATDWPTE